MRFLIILPAIFILASCQTKPEVDTCPLTKLDTHKTEELCHHFADEEPYNAERKAYIERKMKELNCEFYF